MDFNPKKLSTQQLKKLYVAMLKPRMVEEKMLVLLRQGKISKWFSGIGQEAISAGATLALHTDEYLLPMHRNLGVFVNRGIPLEQLFAQFQGKATGFTKGRDRSFHFGSQLHHIVGMISHLGPQLSVGNGIALAQKMQGNGKVTLVFSGDGGTSEGDFHEALNVAAVWDLPIIFLIENNGYGLSTPNNQQFKCKDLIDKGLGYGIPAFKIDGNNILEVYNMLLERKKEMVKKPGPVLIEALTFRMRGHEEASGTAYVPQKLMAAWAAKDPIKNYEDYLLSKKAIDAQFIATEKENIKEEIELKLKLAYAQPLPIGNIENEIADVYAVYQPNEILPKKKALSRSIRYIDAITEGLAQAMDKHQNLVLMGQDIAEYGGVFKITKGFLEKYGSERVRNTPLCESAILGVALGLSVKGYKSMVEMQFADFVTCGFNQIINNLAKTHYRWGQPADVVVRMPTGAGVGAGPFHSQSNEAWFFHTPGLKIVYPSNPYDAKGLLLSAFEDPNPYMYFEHKALYRSASGQVPESYYNLPIGKANLVSTGSDLTIVTYGMGVHWAVEAMQKQRDYQADIIDLRTLLPWDKDTVKQSVEKTGKVLVCHEDCLTGGIAGEIAAWIAEHCFECLDAPLMRAGGLDTPVPFSANLENGFLPKERIAEKIAALLAY